MKDEVNEYCKTCGTEKILTPDEIKAYFTQHGIGYTEIDIAQHDACIGLIVDVYTFVGAPDEPDFQEWNNIDTLRKLEKYRKQAVENNVRKVIGIEHRYISHDNDTFIASRWSGEVMKALIAYFHWVVVSKGLQDKTKIENVSSFDDPRCTQIMLCSVMGATPLLYKQVEWQVYEAVDVFMAVNNVLDDCHALAITLCEKHNVTEDDIVRSYIAAQEKIENKMAFNPDPEVVYKNVVNCLAKSWHGVAIALHNENDNPVVKHLQADKQNYSTIPRLFMIFWRSGISQPMHLIMCVEHRITLRKHWCVI